MTSDELITAIDLLGEQADLVSEVFGSLRARGVELEPDDGELIALMASEAQHALETLRLFGLEAASQLARGDAEIPLTQAVIALSALDRQADAATLLVGRLYDRRVRVTKHEQVTWRRGMQVAQAVSCIVRLG